MEVDKKCNGLKEMVNERIKLIERSIIETQNDSLTELTKKMKILNTPLQTDRNRDITVLNKFLSTSFELLFINQLSVIVSIKDDL